MDKDRIAEACYNVYSACAICAATGRPAPKKKVSMTHVSEAFNEELQADFVYVQIHGEKHEVLNMVDMGTRYGDRLLTVSRSADEVKKSFEVTWFYPHGSPKRLCADHELCMLVLRKYLDMHNIELRPRPSRASSKNVRV